MTKYIYYVTPGHGYLTVPLRELEELGVIDKISSFSFRGDTHAWLEEDCDAVIFFAAKGWKNWQDADPFIRRVMTNELTEQLIKSSPRFPKNAGFHDAYRQAMSFITNRS